MALKTETLDNGLIRHYSTKGKKLLQVETGVIYDEAIDPADSNRIYTETDVSIEGGD